MILILHVYLKRLVFISQRISFPIDLCGIRGTWEHSLVKREEEKQSIIAEYIYLKSKLVHINFEEHSNNGLICVLKPSE
jgi:hypothetical protein